MATTLESLNAKHPSWLITAYGRRYVADRRDANCPGLVQTSRLERMDHLLSTYPGKNKATGGWPVHAEVGHGTESSWEKEARVSRGRAKVQL